MDKKKKCPYCGEEILENAIKCKHCGEWLEKKDSVKPPVSDKIYNWFKNHFWQTVIPFFILVGFLGFKHYLLYKKNHAPLQVIKGWEVFGENSKANEDNALYLLTKSPWHGNNTISINETDNDENISTQVTLDGEKIYTKDNKYTEKGILNIDIIASSSDYIWEVEGKIEWKESGDIVDFYNGTSITEQMIVCSGNIVGLKVKQNFSEASDDEIIAHVKSMLNEMIKSANNSKAKNTYQIKTLTDTTLILENGTILEATGEMLKYSR